MRVGSGFIAARLDHFLVHSSHLHHKSSIKSYIFPSITFDHKPISLHLQTLPNFGPLPFKFNPLWLQHQEVVELVEAHWNTWIFGTPVFIWEQKLSMVKQALKQWAKSFFISPSMEKIQIKHKLEEFQKNIENKEITPQIQKEELNLQCSYQNVLRKEEEFWRLKSRSLWLQARDKNTNFFHNQAKYRQLQNNVSKITLEDGTIVTDFIEIKNVAKSHFEDLYTQREEANQINFETMLENIPSKITNAENFDLNRPILEDEIHSIHMESRSR
jgi:hypothetical protein